MSGWNIRMQQRGLLPSGAKWMVGYQGAWQAAELRLGVDDQRLLDAGEDASEQAIFGQWDQPVAQQWELRGGLRATHYAPKSKMYVSPRLRIKRNLTSKAHLRASWGYYYQFLREITYEDRYGRPQQFLVLADGSNA